MHLAYTQQLADLAHTVGQMAALAGSAMDQATRALLEADLFGAEEVISSYDTMTELSQRAEEKAFALLALRAPVAGDARQVIAGIKITADVERMGKLALHVARIARRRHPEHAVPIDVRPQFAEMGRIAVALACAVRELLESRDRFRAGRLDCEDEAMDELHRRLFTALMDQNWTHEIQAAVDVTLLSRFYERFADHAVAIDSHVALFFTGASRADRGRRLRH
jgi:phosphate transport system protein